MHIRYFVFNLGSCAFRQITTTALYRSIAYTLKTFTLNIFFIKNTKN
ncbi:hypothetical protein SAMN04487893_109101 [Myroides guanonis]|uniref:Uncharacterized protein n=1 Tax=Myroides guanonis TaxID=1150112 RepID=A0A1I3S431_9FLAO|nr:hypothetical protein SAMN04487893_109101 [Myroides guanonis]